MYFYSFGIIKQRLLKHYGVKDSRPDKIYKIYIKVVQKAAAAKGMTVVEYRDKFYFPTEKKRYWFVLKCFINCNKKNERDIK